MKSVLSIFIFSAIPVALFAQGIQTTAVNTVDTVQIEGTQGSDGVVADDFEFSPNDKGFVPGTDGAIADDFEVSPNDKGSVSGITDKKVTPSVISEDGFEVSTKIPTTITNGSGDEDDEAYKAKMKALENTESSAKSYGGAVVTEYDVYIGENATPEVYSAITNLEVKPTEIFSPVFSGVENLVVNSEVVDGKVIYNLEVEDTSKPIFKKNEVVQSIFDFRVDQPVEFKLHNKEIIVNNEQVIKYGEIVRENEVMPPVEIEIYSTITDGKVYDLTVVPGSESAEFKFVYGEKEVMMSIYSDFKVEDKKLHLFHNEEVHDLKVLPQEIYFGVNDLVVKKPKVVIKELSLKIEDEKAIYDLRVEESFKLFWLFSKKIQSCYIISSEDGTVIKKKKPWYTFLGSTDEDDDDIVFLRPE
ncbi:MAG: hypothetical protein KAS07_01935 [Candidatus Pacebacteria bacterium]|nr:hypothetical protein [Candidatus Paceibacterota bacterium]